MVREGRLLLAACYVLVGRWVAGLIVAERCWLSDGCWVLSGSSMGAVRVFLGAGC